MTNRIIKFRVWEIKEKRMLPVDTLSFPVGGIHYYGPGLGDGWSGINPSFEKINKITGLLMQCIGIEDKKGVDIFEGDRVVHEDGSYGFVVWNEGILQFLIGNGMVKHDPIKWNQFTVIGNIYENPSTPLPEGEVKE